MMKKKLPVIAVILALVLLLNLDSTTDNLFQSLNENRPAESWLTPDFSGTVKDVRITALERECNAFSLLPGEKDNPLYGTTCIQIYYGYQIDGKWIDMPCENYDLRAIRRNLSGYDAAVVDHMVRIGPYLLISIKANAEEGDVSIELTDTLGSQAFTMFEEYFTRVWHSPQEGSFSYLTEDRRSFDDPDNIQSKVYAEFDKCTYLLLDYESITEDYVLSVKKKCGAQTQEWTVDYDAIMDILANP